jgi:hypothetical protein
MPPVAPLSPRQQLRRLQAPAVGRPGAAGSRLECGGGQMEGENGEGEGLGAGAGHGRGRGSGSGGRGAQMAAPATAGIGRGRGAGATRPPTPRNDIGSSSKKTEQNGNY